ncbi:hypothetical protein [Nostoc sp. PCC 7107]|uniref:hypothetical protein n=1 Tax=Nostoc sp. PCC 7107 TaxID=317936 RepID=UPI00155B0F3D|nr:hypothetical protein [Nostoc sp. PCC 7107]
MADVMSIKLVLRHLKNLFIFFILGLLAVFLWPNYVNYQKTENYIKNFQIAKYERQGTDFYNPKYSPLRLGKPLEKIDITYDYDFNRLLKVEQKLKGVNRKKALKYIFLEVTKNAQTNTEKHITLLKFLRRSSLHNAYLQPTYPDKTPVFDPLILLELGEMRCGHGARLAVDLFKAGGYKARLVQAGNHVLAEVFYEQQYHYFDTDIFTDGETVIKNGIIPSFAQLSQTPYSIDSVAAYQEVFFKSWIDKEKVKDEIEQMPYRYIYPSYFYFYQKAYEGTLPYYYKKTANVKQEQDKLYGWNYYKSVLDKKRILQESQPIYYAPTEIIFKNIEIFQDEKIDKVILEWEPSKDFDNDLLGYKIYISQHQREWSYNEWRSDKKVEKYWSNRGGWKPKMYKYLDQEPHHEINLLKTSDTKVELSLPKQNTYYVSVMPYDAHGESVGKKVYPMSNEIKLKL